MAGFMSGFGTTLANSIEQDREYYREAASKRRDYLQTYGTRAVVDREDKANAAMGTLNTLRTAGVDDNTLRYVLDKGGIQGVSQLSATIASRKDLTKDDIAGLVKGAKDYVSDNPDETFDTVINRAYGLYQSTDKPVERERNIFSSVLGLDSRMAEDEVLDDLYVNGYSGRDVYRIMGSSGPKAGESLSFNLPAKPPTVGEIKMTNEVLASKFNTSIDSRIKLLTQAQSRKSNTAAENQAIIDESTNLESIKGRGVLGYAEYANMDTTFWDYAKSLEDMTPGVVTRNPTIMDFSAEYESYWGNITDDAKINSSNTGGKGTGGKGTGGEGEVIDFKDLAAFGAAFEAGEITREDRISIDGVLRDWAAEPIDEGKVEVLSSSSINPLTATGSAAVTISEAAAEGVTTALLAGQNTREALGTIADVALPEGELTASYLNATDTMTSALNRGAANAADFIYGVMGGTEQTNVAEWLRSDADRIDAKEDMTAERVSNKANQIAKAYVDGMNSWFSGLFSKETKAEATENVAKVLSRGSDTPAAKALLETIQERVDYARNKRNEPEASEDLIESFIPATMSATELNTPAIKAEQGLMSKRLDDTNRITSEEERAAKGEFLFSNTTGVTRDGRTNDEILAEARAIIAARRTKNTDSFKGKGGFPSQTDEFNPATMSATELNTPAIKAALAKMPARNRANGQTIINAYLTSGVKFKDEAQAKAWIQKNFKGANISKNIVKSLSKVLSNDSNK